ncbi:ExeM/NucH family extracellular endonuclease [Neolewinella persica]|uniref:ExeM/NucH family extracellular endonuclease n=1 Tax=Neolewinella persica TaxID=70998 RepID=UPI00039ABBD4|nr:ExeM/NucH family extracellular endonuclease [Neolewinella persica]
MRLFSTLLALCLTLMLSAQDVILTAIVDPDNGTQTPRVIELYVSGTVDLSNYRLERAANNNAFPDASLALSGTYTDAFVYAINNEPSFVTAFGNTGDFANVVVDANFVSGNGDDRFRLVRISDGVVIDQTGGDVRASIYQDSYLYRVDNTGPDGGWIATNWMNVGNNNTLDGLTLAQLGTTVPLGTYMTTPPGPSVSAAGNGDLSEPGTNGGFTISLSQTDANNITVNYTLSGTAANGFDYADANGGSVTITAGQLSAPLNLTVLDDADSEPTESIEITLTGVSSTTFALGGGATISLFDDEPVGTFFIHAVQGNGATSPVVGQDVTIQGIVVGDFQGGTGVGLGGFFVQEEDADADADAATSEGIWVYDDTGATDVAVGDLVTVTGAVEESSDLTQINVTGGGASVMIVSSGNTLPTAASLDLPVASEAVYEAFEGMLTTLIDNAVITETFGVARFGEFVVSESERQIQFSECNTPDPGTVGGYNDLLALGRLTVDDGRSGDNNFPIVLPDGSNLTATNSLRSGTVFTGLTGVLDERFTGYRLQFTAFTTQVDNPRPTTAPAVGGFVKVVGMNVLNYFTTLGSRGANNANEFDRQEAKIVAAICELDADILGLVEIENNGFGANSALQTLVDAIQAECGIVYDFVVNPNSGSDGIQVALIYKPSVVEESGTAANLTVAAGNFNSNRIPLTQTFRVVEAGNMNLGQQITVCVNHWKSKGSDCGGAPDDDTGGAGNCNGTRLAAATTILDWLTNDDPTGTGVTDQLVIGDLNAYSEESPITTFTDAGWSNTVRDNAGAGSFPCGSVASYVFRGEWGSLDHALASPTLASKITGSIPWGVNAEEPTALDYDTQFNDPALYGDDFYRFSDHNPVVIGMDLGMPLPVELAEFSGRAQGKNVLLDWRTATEEATDRFEVQRRDSRGNFATLGTVVSEGNSLVSRSYEFTDDAPLAGMNIYRLRIIDLDGSTAFSDLVNIEFDGEQAMQMRQVTARHLQLTGAEEKSDYLFSNAAGMVIRQGEINTAVLDIDGTELPAGLYLLSVRAPAGAMTTFKVILP